MATKRKPKKHTETIQQILNKHSKAYVTVKLSPNAWPFQKILKRIRGKKK